MKQLSILSLSAVLIFSTFATAQNTKTDHSESITKYQVMRHSNGINYDLFDDYGYENNFGEYRYLPASQSIRYNRVDALFIGIGTDFARPGSDMFTIGGLEFDGFLGYSTGQRDVQYRAEVSKRIGTLLLIGGEFLKASTSDDYWRTSSTENTLTSLVAGYDYHDYYQAEGFGVFSEAKLGRLISLGGSYNYTAYRSLQTNTEYSFFDGGNIGRINPSIDPSTDNIEQESVGLYLGINKKGYTKGLFTSKLLAEAELSDIGFNNDFNYNKFEVTSLNYLKLDKNTLFKFRVKAGSITGEAPEFKNFALGGIGSLRASGYKFYRGDKMLLSNAEFVFGDFWDIDNGNLETDGLYLSLFLDSGWTNITSSDSNNLFEGFNTFKFGQLTHNIGAGIGTGFVRFEVATPVAGSEGFTSLWIRLNPTF